MAVSKEETCIYARPVSGRQHFYPLDPSPVAKLTPGAISYYVVKIRGKLESGLAVKTVSITTGVGDTGSGWVKREYLSLSACISRAKGVVLH